jgi:hypothetical protein
VLVDHFISKHAQRAGRYRRVAAGRHRDAVRSGGPGTCVSWRTRSSGPWCSRRSP